MRTINAIYTAGLGEEWTNARVLPQLHFLLWGGEAGR